MVVDNVLGIGGGAPKPAESRVWAPLSVPLAHQALRSLAFQNARACQNGCINASTNTLSDPWLVWRRIARTEHQQPLYDHAKKELRTHYIKEQDLRMAIIFDQSWEEHLKRYCKLLGEIVFMKRPFRGQEAEMWACEIRVVVVQAQQAVVYAIFLIIVATKVS